MKYRIDAFYSSRDELWQYVITAPRGIWLHHVHASDFRYESDLEAVWEAKQWLKRSEKSQNLEIKRVRFLS